MNENRHLFSPLTIKAGLTAFPVSASHCAPCLLETGQNYSPMVPKNGTGIDPLDRYRVVF